MPIKVRLRTIEYQLTNLKKSASSSSQERFLRQIYSACADSSPELIFEQEVGNALLPLVQLLPELQRLQLVSYNPSSLSILRHIPLKARIVLLEELFGAQNPAVVDSPGVLEIIKNNFEELLQACKSNSTKLCISSIFALERLAPLTMLLPELKLVKIDSAPSLSDINLRGVNNLEGIETLIINGHTLKSGNLSFLHHWHFTETLRELRIDRANLWSLDWGNDLVELRKLSLSSVNEFCHLDCYEGPMRRLRELSIEGASELTTLGTMRDFPALELLRLTGVSNLGSLQGLENLPALRKIVISPQDQKKLLPQLIGLSLPPDTVVFIDRCKMGHFAAVKNPSKVSDQTNSTIFVATSSVERSFTNLGNSLVSIPEGGDETLSGTVGGCTTSVGSLPELPLSVRTPCFPR